MKKTCPGQSGINKTLNLIPKGGKNPHNPANYRPISPLEVPGKIFERIINHRLRTFLEDSDIHNDLQFRFRPARETTHALALVTEIVAQQKADGGQCHLVLRDITKAFDKVWHLGMKYKILHLGLPIILEKLLCDFLDDRSARIRLRNYLGDSFDLSCGVPQGSVLSPTLFTLYTRDTLPPLRGTSISYADDVTQIVGYPGKSFQMAQLSTSREIDSLNSYESRWRIQTNTNKFTVMRLVSRTNEQLITTNDTHHAQQRRKNLGLHISINGYYKHVQTRV